MAKKRLKEEQIQEGKVYTDGRRAGIRVKRIYDKFGCKMVQIENVVGKQYHPHWTMGSFLAWAAEEVEMPEPIEMPAAVKPIVEEDLVNGETSTDEPIRDAEETGSGGTEA